MYKNKNYMVGKDSKGFIIVWIKCKYCGEDKLYRFDREVWLDSMKEVFDNVRYVCDECV
jgi:hypothetical protein